jgi:hypothetical protein
MPDAAKLLLMYLRLAAVAHERRKPYQCDRLLVLAAVAAEELDRWEFAEACRRRVLENNPGHMLKRFDSMAEALADDDFQPYLRRLLREWPYEKAEHVLAHPDVETTEASHFSEAALTALLGLEMERDV